MSAKSFSNDGEGAITRTLRTDDLSTATHDLLSSAQDDRDLEEFFEVNRCVKWVKENSFQRFPDALLGPSVHILFLLEKETGVKMSILADSTYGSCCVDEKTSRHVDGDALIHFGHACLASMSSIPVLYIFTQPKINPAGTIDAFRKNYSKDDKVLILYDVIYENLALKAFDKISESHSNAELSQLVIPGPTNQSLHDSKSVCHGRSYTSNENQNIFYIGSSNMTLLNFRYAFPTSSFSIYDPLTSQNSSLDSSIIQISNRSISLTQFLMKRNYYIEKCKSSQSVGILIGTLGIEKYREVISQIKDILRRAGKKFYIVSIGEITPPKLANFPDIEIFVLVACPECTIIDSKEFFQPIITPYELHLALNENRSWEESYITDFKLLLPGGTKYVEFSEGENEKSQVSLITGEIIDNCSDLWRGLDIKEKGTDEVYEGRSGVAAHYIDEPI